MTQSSEDLIVWPDSTTCFAYELHEMTHMSDDYKRIPYGSEEWELAYAEYCR